VHARTFAFGFAAAFLAGVALPAALSGSALATVPAPKITTCLPTGGAAVGKLVTIHGTGLAGATKVTFNAVAAKPTTDTAKLIKTKLPAGAKVGSGAIHVTTPGGTATCPFTVKKTTKGKK
jgi:hypothetical protein